MFRIIKCKNKMNGQKIKKLRLEEIKFAVQINGKTRDIIKN